jgi:small subunit ribosomal protein S17
MERRRKTFVGQVVSNKMNKTVVVVVESRKPHPLYRRIVRRVKKFKAHDENNDCNPGDVVRIEETRPLSKEKCWRVVEIVSKGRLAEVRPEEIA